MNFIKKIFIFILLVCNLPIYGSPNDFYEVQNLPESKFYDKLINETVQTINSNELLTEMQKSELIKKSRRIIVFIKESNPYLHVKEIFLKHGLGAGITAFVTEVVTVGILPPTFISMGLESLAAISVSAPSFLATVPVYVNYSNFNQKLKLLKDTDLKFNIESLDLTKNQKRIYKILKGLKLYRLSKRFIQKKSVKKLDRIRNEILMFNFRQRITSLKITDSQISGHFHLVDNYLKRIINATENYLQLSDKPIAKLISKLIPNMKNNFGHTIELYELESIVSKYYGRHYLFLLKEKAKKKHESGKIFLTHYLMFAISKKEESKNDFIKLIENKMLNPSRDIDDLNFYKLILVNEKQQQIRRSIGSLKRIKKRWIKSIFYDFKNLEEQKLIHSFFDDLQEKYEKLSDEITISEYQFLKELEDNGLASYPYEKYSKKLKNLETITDKFNQGNKTNFPLLINDILDSALSTKKRIGETCVDFIRYMFTGSIN